MSRKLKIKNFDPNGVGVHNGRFVGLPFDQEEAQVVLVQAPWDVTVSSGNGTCQGPDNILQASYQLDLYDDFVSDAWKMGLFMEPHNDEMLLQSKLLRANSEKLIAALEDGQEMTTELSTTRTKINAACREMIAQIKEKCISILDNEQYFGIIGGDHSVALAGIKAISKKYKDFGILQIDAHMDLRNAYEGFDFSHASIFYNAMKIKEVSKLVQVGIRDYCEEEMDLVNHEKGRISVFTDTSIQEAKFNGSSFDLICTNIVEQLPQNVYISFDIDGLMPSYCQNTGTPVPGGLSFAEAKYLLKKVVLSNRRIIGFDLCEVAGSGHDYDGNVGARLAYTLSNYMGKSLGLI
jgi:agmatinase